MNGKNIIEYGYINYIEIEEMKNKLAVNHQQKTFKKKSNSLKIFSNEHKRSSKTIKNILSDKQLNINEISKKSDSRKSNQISKKSKSKNSKKQEKENQTQKKTKKEISQPKLDTFVTKVKQEEDNKDNFASPILQSNKIALNDKNTEKICNYYMEGLHKAFIKRSSDYFSNLHRVHFNQSLQFINVKKGLNLSNYVTNGKSAYVPGSNNFIFHN